MSKMTCICHVEAETKDAGCPKCRLIEVFNKLNLEIEQKILENQKEKCNNIEENTRKHEN